MIEAPGSREGAKGGPKGRESSSPQYSLSPSARQLATFFDGLGRIGIEFHALH